MTKSQHEEVIELVKDMMLVDPADLLPQHQHLLQQDYRKLGESSSIDKKLWLSKMHSALSAATNVSSSPSEPGAEPSQRIQGGMAKAALSSYTRYRTKSGLSATKRSNMAKKARL